MKNTLVPIENIKLPNKEYLENIIKNFKKDGKNNIHILADFNKTLTRSFYNSKIRPSLISVLRKEGYLGNEYTKKAQALFDKYHPIEIDPSINIKTKKAKMYEWWNIHLKLLVDYGLHKQDIEKVINSGSIKLRDGIKEFLETLNKNNIPLIIISANGLGGDSIKLYLEQEKLFFPNIHIISNNFTFNKKGKVIGYSTKIIHTFNKDNTILYKYPKIYKK